MKTKYVYYMMIVMVGLSGVLIIALGYFGNSIFRKQADKIVQAKLEYKLLEEEQNSLFKASKEVEQYAEFESIARSIVPQDKDQARTIRELEKIAIESGIVLDSISFRNSTLGSTGSQSGNVAPSQLQPVEGIKGVYALEIIIAPNKDIPIPYNKFIDFLDRLERNRRTSHVQKILLNPSQNGSTINFTITLNAYVKP